MKCCVDSFGVRFQRRGGHERRGIYSGKPLLIWVESKFTAFGAQQLNGTEYTGRIHDEKLVEKQLALGGIRLAGIINEVLATEDEKLEFGVLPSLSAS
ncbi:hypothetical protein RHS01_02281 [Rhizoctonia solani]|uniref:Uncharacterized protein n=1 Tax=Rhizoctonia solani TaxID=456999 RepID=A0A8H7M8X2_9AGAM|nr:hypothetical protein RHS01_02281 [Rhizoctonia solani]